MASSARKQCCMRGTHVRKCLIPLQVQAWNCVHNVLQAHAAAVKQFRALVPNGKISINLNCDWAQPLTGSPSDAVVSLDLVPQLCIKQSGFAAGSFLPHHFSG